MITTPRYSSTITYSQQPKPSEYVLSLDNYEWYYGRPENRTRPEKRKLITTFVQENEIISRQQADAINGYFSFINIREKETLKRKKRPFFIDAGLFIR